MAFATILGDSIVSQLPDVIPGTMKIGYSGANVERLIQYVKKGKVRQTDRQIFY